MTSYLNTLDNHILLEQKYHPEATGELSNLLYKLGLAFKVISNEIRRAGINDIFGYIGHNNIHGEAVKKLDKFANETLINAAISTGQLCALGSEETQGAIHITSGKNEGKYVLVFDPLDGSSNIEAGISIGTIFSIYKRKSPDNEVSTIEDLLQPGIEQVVAGYVIYGSSTILMYTSGHGVNGFTLDTTLGEFLHTYHNVKIPESSNQYSVNEGYYHMFSPGVQKYLDWVKEIDKKTDRPYTSRYIGTMVADVHRIIHYGGIFMYPATTKNPNGKLRLVYECNPLSFIVEAAGGYSIDGKNRILEVKPENLHQRIPIFIGSINNVKKVAEFIEKYG
jgi:fructose-1,6-bisphosphatase I